MLSNITWRVSMWYNRWLYWDDLRTKRKTLKHELYGGGHLFCSLGGPKPSICSICRKSLKDHK